MSPNDPLTVDEVQERLSAALDLEARGQFPDARRPPAVDWPVLPVRRRPSWVAPLATAAVVAAMAATAGIVVADRNTQTQDLSPATASVSPAPVPPSSPATAAPTTTGQTVPPTTVPPADSPTSAPTAASTATSVSVGGATLVVPSGYTVRADLGTGGGSPISDRWCIDTAGTTDCVVAFSRLRPDRNPLNSDAAGDYDSNPQYCGPGTPSRLVDYRDTTLGGRPAEYRAWRWDCQGRPGVDVAQYSVMTPTPYELFSDRATAQVKSLMDGIARSSRLPAPTGSVRLYDHGILRTTQSGPVGGTTITLDRTIVGAPNNSPMTYDYVVPAGGRWDPTALAALVGQTVTVRTDGQVVVELVGP